MKNNIINKHNGKQLNIPAVRRSYSNDWVFCNTDLVPYPYDYSSDYKCPKCGGVLVNALGTCATKVYK